MYNFILHISRIIINKLKIIIIINNKIIINKYKKDIKNNN